MPAPEPVPVALVLNSFEAGGTEHQMTELARRLDPALFAVHVVCLGDRGPLRSRIVNANLPIVEFPMRGFLKPATTAQLLRFARWCRRARIQIVHACDFYANVFAMPGAAVARVPVRIASRRDVVVPERRPAHLRAQHVSYRFAHRIVANSTAAVSRLAAEGIRRSAVVHIANGLDLGRFAPSRRAGAAPIVTTVANLRPGKGHEVLLEAAAQVLRRAPDVRFRIVGDGSRRQALESEAARLGIAGRIDFAGHCEDVAPALQQSDVFAFPSLMEASPNAVLEAMAAGLPVVASDAGGIPEVVRHRQNGLLVPPGEPGPLAAAILELLDSPSLRAELGAAARQTVRARFSFDRMTADFQALYASELALRAGWPGGAPRPFATTAA